MAEHNLTIKATLDTSSVQRELDQINRTVMTMNGATGVSGSTRNSGGIGNLNKISTAIDRLNRTIDKLSNQMTRMGQQALDRGRETISRGGYVDVGSSVAPVARGGKVTGPKTGIGAWVRANRFARADAMPMFMAASWGKQLGASMEDLGMNEMGAGFGFLGDVMGGAATGAIRGGAWGAAIGAMIAGLVSASEALAKFENTLKNVEEGISLEKFGIKRLQEQEAADIEADTLKNFLDGIQKGRDTGKLSTEAARRMLVGANEEERKYSYMGDAEKNYKEHYDQAAYFRREIIKDEKALEDLDKRREDYINSPFVWEVGDVKIPLARWAQTAGKWGLGGPIGVPLAHQLNIPSEDDFAEEAEEIKKRIKLHKENLAHEKTLTSSYKQMMEQIDKAVKQTKKWDEDDEKEQKRNAEKMKKLTDRRSNLLLDIEDDYTQQGVDLLTSMGKAGKYMSSMELASLNQDRYSPITKKMDDM